jgi:circadian clock protein KaiB
VTDVDALSGRERGWALTLYVSGASPRSAEAINTTRLVCDTDLGGQVDLEIVDVARDPLLAHGDDIMAVPTLVRRLPLPRRKLTGDLADADRVRAGLEIRRAVAPVGPAPAITPPADRDRSG